MTKKSVICFLLVTAFPLLLSLPVLAGAITMLLTGQKTTDFPLKLVLVLGGSAALSFFGLAKSPLEKDVCCLAFYLSSLVGSSRKIGCTLIFTSLYFSRFFLPVYLTRFFPPVTWVFLFLLVTRGYFFDVSVPLLMQIAFLVGFKRLVRVRNSFLIAALTIYLIIAALTIYLILGPLLTTMGIDPNDLSQYLFDLLSGGVIIFYLFIAKSLKDHLIAFFVLLSHSFFHCLILEKGKLAITLTALLILFYLVVFIFILAGLTS